MKKGCQLCRVTSHIANSYAALCIPRSLMKKHPICIERFYANKHVCCHPIVGESQHHQGHASRLVSFNLKFHVFPRIPPIPSVYLFPSFVLLYEDT